MEGSTRALWSDDGAQVTFVRPGTEERIGRFIRRLRTSLPVLEAKLPVRQEGLSALANAAWLTREEYQGPLRDQAFGLLERHHFIQDLSSGTTGEPVIRFHHWRDELAEQLLTRRVFSLAGIGPDDRVVCLEIGAPEISTFYFRALAELGVTDRSFLHVTTDFFGSLAPLERLDPTVIVTVPGVLARCAPRFFEIYNGQQPLSLRRMVHYAEPLSQHLRQRLEALGVESFSFYGTTEAGGIAGECPAHEGLHVQDDWVVPSLREVEEREPGVFRGEVGWTAMHFEAQPLLKYAVGDLVELDTRPCRCGAPGARLRFRQRIHDVISIYGLKFGSRTLERAVGRAVDCEEPLVQIVLDDAPAGMKMTVRLCEDHEPDPARVVKSLYKVFEIDEMLDMGYLTIEVEPVARSFFDQRKLRRVIDQRSSAPFA